MSVVAQTRSAGRQRDPWGDQAYPGQRVVIRQHVPKAQDFVNATNK
jgi:hypothetical protein